MRNALKKIGACAALAAITVVAACSSEESSRTPQASSPTSKNANAIAEEMGSTPFSLCSEAEGLSLLRLQNLEEIHSALAIRDRLLDRDLQSLVDQVIEDHRVMADEVEAAFRASNAQGVETSMTRALRASIRRGLLEAETIERTDIDRTFVLDQILDHMHAIGLIDNLILPSMVDTRLSELVLRTRDMLVRHARLFFEREASFEGACSDRPVIREDVQ